MLLFLVSTLFPLIAALFLLPILFLFKSQRFSDDDSKLPPGKLGWPFIGETLAYFKDGKRGVPEKFFQDRTQNFRSEIFKTSLFGANCVVVCGSAANKFLYSNENTFVRSWYLKSIRDIFPPPPATKGVHMFFHKLVLAFVKPEALQRYAGLMDSVAKVHFKNYWENKEEVTVVPLSDRYIMEATFKVFVSMDDPIQIAKLDQAFSTMSFGIWSLPINIPGTSFYKALKASKLIKRDVAEIIRRRKIDLANKKASPEQDILSHLLTTSGDESGEDMSDSGIAGLIVAVLIAGHGTTSSVISLVVNYLAEYPHVYSQVLAEQMGILKSKAPGELVSWEDVQKMKYSWNVACEVMRLHPPAQGSFREAITDFTFAGYRIKNGFKLHWNPYATHKNPKYFPDAEKFDPTRFEGSGPAPFTFVPFGGGPRMCPGREYARIEILIFMHNLVTKFKWEKVIPGEKVIVDPTPLPMKGLPIRLQSHAW